MTPAQCRAARGLVNLTARALADEANVSQNTVLHYEIGRRTPNPNNYQAIKNVLESYGVVFTNGDEPGVKLKKQHPKNY